MDIYTNLIDSFLRGEINYDQFFNEISDKFALADSSKRNLSKDEEAFIAEVYERSTFAGKEATIEDKKYGIMTDEEYRNWLVNMKEQNIRLWR